VKAIPRAARLLIVTCFDLGQRRFGGMARLLGEMQGTDGFAWSAWGGERVSLGLDTALEALVLSGHGSPEWARLGDGESRGLTPADVELPPAARLYLLGCHQGRDDLRRAWAAGTGVALGSVLGAESETETLLSTLFLLHLEEEGRAALPELFAQWVLANRLIRPFFGPAREMYAGSGGDPLHVLDWLGGVADLGPVAGFLDLARRRPEYLSGLASEERCEEP
jgi:hypothetical protein